MMLPGDGYRAESGGTLRERMGARFEDLTVRERECLYLATRFMRPKEIAAQIDRSPKTVETHLAKATAKLGADNLRHAVKLYADFLSETGSGNNLRETSRLSDSLTPPSLIVPQAEAAQASGRELREDSEPILRASRSISSPSRFPWLRKGVDPDDLTTTNMLFLIVWVAIALAVALAATVGIADAFTKLASIFSPRP